MSRRLRLRQHDKRRPTPEPADIPWEAIARDREQRQQPQPVQPKGQP